MKTFCFIIKSKLHDNPCINEVLGLPSSLLTYQDWNFSKSTSTLKSDLQKKKKIQKLEKYFLLRKGNGLFFNLKLVS